MKGIKNVLWTLSEKSTKLMFGIGVSALAARYFGPESFGVVNLSISILTIAIVFSSLGMNRIITRESVSASAEDIVPMLFDAFLIRLIFSIFISIPIFYYVLSSTPEQYKPVMLIVASAVIFSSTDVYEMYYQGKRDFRIVSIIRLFSFVACSLAKIVFIYQEFSIVWFAFAIFCEYLIVSILLFFRLKLRHDNIKFVKVNIRRTVQSSKKILTESWPEILAGLGAILFMKLDVVMLATMAGADEVGVYTAASRITEAWYFIPMAIVSTTFPKIVSDSHDCKLKYINSLETLTWLLILISLIVIFSLYAFGEGIILFLFGVEYSESYSILVIHAWSGIFMCFGIASGSWLATERKLKYNLYRNMFGLSVNFILNVSLIPQLGGSGAAIATVVSMFCAYYLFDYFVGDMRAILKVKHNAVKKLAYHPNAFSNIKKTFG
ncbi:flippase [Vibrio fluvialis]|nr:flippase [Vibrio fluvialis]